MSYTKSISLVLLLSIFIFSSQHAHGQSRRYVLWFTPSGAREIYGVAAGLMASPEFGHPQTVTGINAEVGPWGAFGFIFVPFTTLIAPFNRSTESSQFLFSGNAYLDNERPLIFIHGINLSLGGHAGPTEISGISLNGVFTHTHSMTGISGALFMNVTYTFNGVLFSMRNKATIGKGLMFGMFNNCEDCTGIQIGLINRMGNLTLPLINFRKKRKGR